MDARTRCGDATGSGVGPAEDAAAASSGADQERVRSLRRAARKGARRRVRPAGSGDLCRRLRDRVRRTRHAGGRGGSRCGVAQRSAPGRCRAGRHRDAGRDRLAAGMDEDRGGAEGGREGSAGRPGRSFRSPSGDPSGAPPSAAPHASSSARTWPLLPEIIVSVGVRARQRGGSSGSRGSIEPCREQRLMTQPGDASRRMHGSQRW